MTNQERNREALIDHALELENIIRQRNAELDQAEVDLADYQAMHSQQIETIARLQKTVRKAVEKVQVREGAMNRLGTRAEKAEQERDSVQAALVCAIQENERLRAAAARPLTADDGMLSRAVLEARKHKGTALALHSEVQAIVNAALTEPKPRPEGAEGVESQIEQWLYDEGPEDPIKARDLRSLADFLAERGVRVTGDQS